MLTKDEIVHRQAQAAELIERSGIVLTEDEKRQIEIADFGLGEFERTGLAIVVYVNTDRCCAKELAMLPGQTCPEHRHPPISAANPGKEETFRCRSGRVYLYVAGEPTPSIRATVPPAPQGAYTVCHEVVLEPGQQYTLGPDTLHWFQAGPDGAVVSEFSTRSLDEKDVFTDPRIARITKVAE